MGHIRFHLPCQAADKSVFPPLFPGDRCRSIRAIDPVRDQEDVVEFAASIRNADAAAGWGLGGLSPRALAGELRSRPGRRVEGWFARDQDTADDQVADRPVGLLILVRVGLVTPRFSIAWLLVHPRERRQKIGTALVLRAVERVVALGGTGVSVETLDSWPDATAFWRRMAAALTGGGTG